MKLNSQKNSRKNPYYKKCMMDEKIWMKSVHRPKNGCWVVRGHNDYHVYKLSKLGTLLVLDASTLDELL